MTIHFFSKALLIIVWLATLGVALVWIFADDPPFNPEPLTIILGLAATAITALVSEYSQKLREESFSPAHALAYGYVTNFIEPAITSLTKIHAVGPVLFIYIPERLAELEPRSVDRIITHIRQKQFKDHIVTLDFAEGRARDIISLRGLGNDPVYFDFPNTLLTLKSFIDHKLSTEKKGANSEKRETLGKAYIQKFKEAVESQARQKGILGYLKFVDKDLKIEK